jgi:hypothetical protein
MPSHRTLAISLLSAAACIAVCLSLLHDSRSLDAQHAALQTSLFLLPEVERPPHHYTGKW